MLALDSSTAFIQKTSLANKISGVLLNKRYAIAKVIGRGGIGITYLGFDSYQFNKLCVIKEFAPFGQPKQQIEKLKDLFIHESQILYQLEHPQIPKFYACFERNERLFLVREYIDGKSYGQLLKERVKQEKTFSELEVLTFLRNTLAILTYIHNNGVIHRDISPCNIMQPRNGKLPILIDFGVGKKCDDLLQEKTDNSINHYDNYTLVGKIGYASPEQLRFGKCSASSDLYSLGISAIALLIGKHPSEFINYDLQSQWHNEIKVSKNLAAFISKLTAYAPKQRYQSAEEALVHLESLFTSSYQVFKHEF